MPKDILFRQIVYKTINYCIFITYKGGILMIKTINLRRLIPCLLIPLFTGLIGQLFSQNAKEIYSNLQQPPLSPPSIVFPFVWTLLYILLGIASYFIEESNCDKKRPRQAYTALLALNLLWPIVFFTFEWFTFAAVIVVLMLAAAVITLILFYNCDKNAGYLILPLILWLIFAAYLNIGVVVLN